MVLRKGLLQLQELEGAEEATGSLSLGTISCQGLCQPLWTLRVFGRFTIEEAKFRTRQELCQVGKSQD